jgi:hypothetical protein
MSAALVAALVAAAHAQHVSCNCLAATRAGVIGMQSRLQHMHSAAVVAATTGLPHRTAPANSAHRQSRLQHMHSSSGGCNDRAAPSHSASQLSPPPGPPSCLSHCVPDEQSAHSQQSPGQRQSTGPPLTQQSVEPLPCTLQHHTTASVACGSFNSVRRQALHPM